MKFTKEEIAMKIDYTLLKPNVKLEEIEKICREAIEFNFAAVAIPPVFIKYANEILNETNIKIDAPIGFPFGYSTTETKIFETEDAIKNGAREVDMVVNISAVKDRNWEVVKKDIEDVAKVCGDLTFKVIFENCYLDKEEIRRLAEICLEIPGVDYIKTSTGFGPGGATVEDVRFMKAIVKNKIKVKASGGIRTYQDFLNMVNAGADRIGTSSALEILKQVSE